MNRWKCDTCKKVCNTFIKPRRSTCHDCIQKDWDKNGTPCGMCGKKLFMNIEKYREMGGEHFWLRTMAGPDRDGVPTTHSARRYLGGYKCQNRKVNPDEENITWRRWKG